jgi:COMPASS component SPP1
MQSRIAQWENSGGTRDLLWDSVKNAEKREGVVVRAKTNGVTPHIKMGIDGDTPEREDNPPDAAAKRRSERDIARLNARLEQVVKEREMMKHEMDMVLWRENVVGLASERAEKVDECGWDQRLCFGEEEWADFGAEVVESFEEGRAKTQSGDDAMQVDGATASHGEWWCSGKKKCERHAG